MDLKLKNKVALVTGSTRGIGLEIAKNLEEEGCIVVFNGRKKLSKNFNYISADITKFDECQKLIKKTIQKFGHLDILVCNVGSGKVKNLDYEKQTNWDEMFSINLYSTTNIIKSAQKELAKTRGVITCISSIAGIETTSAPITYAVSKSALNAFVKTSSKKFANKKIRINAIAPGNIMFNGSTWEQKMKKNPSAIKKMINEKVSMKRFGTPNDISSLAVFLSSEKASFITGAVYVVDGGQINS